MQALQLLPPLTSPDGNVLMRRAMTRRRRGRRRRRRRRRKGGKEGVQERSWKEGKARQKWVQRRGRPPQVGQHALGGGWTGLLGRKRSVLAKRGMHARCLLLRLRQQARPAAVASAAAAMTRKTAAAAAAAVTTTSCPLSLLTKQHLNA